MAEHPKRRKTGDQGLSFADPLAGRTVTKYVPLTTYTRVVQWMFGVIICVQTAVVLLASTGLLRLWDKRSRFWSNDELIGGYALTAVVVIGVVYVIWLFRLNALGVFALLTAIATSLTALQGLAELQPNEIETAIDAAAIMSFVLACVVFAMWLYRACQNQKALGDRSGCNPPLAAAMVFIPICNLVGPLLVVLRLQSGAKTPRNLAAAYGWWLCFWVAIALQGYVMLNHTAPDDVNLGLLALFAASRVCRIISCLAGIWMVGSIDKHLQEERD